jgi:hypothetical protein
LAEGFPAEFEDILFGSELDEGGDRGVHNIGVIARAEGFGEDIADADRFEDGSDASAGNDAGSR